VDAFGKEKDDPKNGTKAKGKTVEKLGKQAKHD
jgi:hypothetical protein